MKWLLLILLLIPLTTNALTQSPSLNGSSQGFSAADSVSLSPTGNLTAEGWMKITALPTSGNTMSVIGKWVDSGSQDSWLVQLHNPSGTQQIRFLNSNDGSSVGLCTFNYTAATAEWHYWEMNYTAATPLFEVFVDGVSVGSCTGTLKTSIFNGTGLTTLGEDNSSGWLNAALSNWRIWTSVRANADYPTNACNALGVTTDLSAEWSLDNVLTDNSGNSNTLTNIGSTAFSADVPALCSTGGSTFQLWPLSLF